MLAEGEGNPDQVTGQWSLVSVVVLRSTSTTGAVVHPTSPSLARFPGNKPSWNFGEMIPTWVKPHRSKWIRAMQGVDCSGHSGPPFRSLLEGWSTILSCLEYNCRDPPPVFSPLQWAANVELQCPDTSLQFGTPLKDHPSSRALSRISWGLNYSHIANQLIPVTNPAFPPSLQARLPLGRHISQ